MNISVPKINIQAHLWALTGPLLVTFTLFIVLVRSASITWELPLIAISGLILCYKWHWKGVITSTVLLGAVAVYHLTGHNAHDWMWVVTLTLALMTALVVTGLTVEESYHAWDLLWKEVEGGRKTLKNITETAQQTQSRYQIERQELTSRLETLQGELDKRMASQEATDRLVSIVRDELTVMHEGQSRLIQELHEARQQVAVLSNRFDPPEPAEVVPPVDNQLEIALRAQLEASEIEIHQLKAREEVILIEGKLAREQIEGLASELKGLRQQVKSAEELVLVSLQEQETLQEEIKKLTIQTEMVGKEKLLLENTIAGLQSEFDRTRHDNQELTKQVDSLKAHATSLESEREGYINREADQKNQYAMIRDELIASQERFNEVSMNESKLHAELEALKEEAAQIVEVVEDRPAEIRRLEGLYKQLRMQFDEKSQTLDSTRKDLFLTQEKFLALNKEYEELTISGDRDITKQIEELIVENEQEIISLKREYDEEVNNLHAIITKLSGNK